MIIDVDMGNTRIKWRIAGDEYVHACDGWEQALQEWALVVSVERVRVSSVLAESIQVEFAGAVKGTLGVDVEFACVKDGVRGLQLHYDDISRLGVDRWLSMLAVRELNASKSWLVLNVGTACVADFVDCEKGHLGGYIVPGLGLSLEALSLGTAKIGLAPANIEKDWQPGNTTIECVQGGLSNMYQGYLKSLWARACDLMEAPSLAWSGGGADGFSGLFSSESDEIVRVSLALDGLAVALP